MARALAASVIAATVMASPAANAGGMGAHAALAAVASGTAVNAALAAVASGTAVNAASVGVPEAQNSSAAQPDEARTLTLTADAVIVRAPDGSEVQCILFDLDALTDLNRD